MGKSHAQWFTRNEVKCLLLWEIWIYSFSRKILEIVFVEGIVNIRNDCPFFLLHGEWKICLSPRSDSRVICVAPKESSKMTLTNCPITASRFTLFFSRTPIHSPQLKKKTLVPEISIMSAMRTAYKKYEKEEDIPRFGLPGSHGTYLTR